MEKVQIITEKDRNQLLSLISTVSNYLHGHSPYDGAEEDAKEAIEKLYKMVY